MPNTKPAKCKAKKPKQHVAFNPLDHSFQSLLSFIPNCLPILEGKLHGGNLSEKQIPRGANGHGEKSEAREALRSWRPWARKEVRHRGPHDILSQSLAVTLTSHFIIRSCGAYFLLSNDAPFYLFACIISAKTTTTTKTRK